MKEADILQRVPIDTDFSYSSLRKINFWYLNHFRDKGASIYGCVNWNMEEHEEDMDLNGMEKFTIMLVSMLFEMEHEEVEPEMAFSVKWDILDFESGNYDDLFSAEDLKLIKADIAKINAYLDEHPELIEGVEEERRAAQNEN